MVIDNLGKIRVTFKGNTVTYKFGIDGEPKKIIFKILDHGKDWLLMTLADTQTLKYRIVIDDKGYWQTTEGTGVTFRERFRRTK